MPRRNFSGMWLVGVYEKVRYPRPSSKRRDVRVREIFRKENKE